MLAGASQEVVIDGFKMFQITDQEFWSNGMMSFGDQMCLAILKKKGAPIIGVLWLEVDPKYLITSNRDELGRRTFFGFKLLKPI